MKAILIALVLLAPGRPGYVHIEHDLTVATCELRLAELALRVRLDPRSECIPK